MSLHSNDNEVPVPSSSSNNTPSNSPDVKRDRTLSHQASDIIFYPSLRTSTHHRCPLLHLPCRETTSVGKCQLLLGPLVHSPLSYYQPGRGSQVALEIRAVVTILDQRFVNFRVSISSHTFQKAISVGYFVVAQGKRDNIGLVRGQPRESTHPNEHQWDLSLWQDCQWPIFAGQFKWQFFQQ